MTRTGVSDTGPTSDMSLPLAGLKADTSAMTPIVITCHQRLVTAMRSTASVA